VEDETDGEAGSVPVRGSGHTHKQTSKPLTCRSLGKETPEIESDWAFEEGRNVANKHNPGTAL